MGKDPNIVEIEHTPAHPDANDPFTDAEEEGWPADE